MGDSVFDPVHDVRRVAPVPPDQDQRLSRDEHGLGPHRRTRTWLVVAAGVALVAAFVLIVAIGGGDEEPQPGSGVVVDSPP